MNNELPIWVHPAHPRFATYASRLESFSLGYPQESPASPEELAANGFYYYGSFEGITDSVKRYVCGIAICLWERGDDVAENHAEMNPRCIFVQQLKKRKQDNKDSSPQDANAIVELWMTTLLVQHFEYVTFRQGVVISKTQLRNVLYDRFMKIGVPFDDVGDLAAEYSSFVNQKYGLDFKINVPNPIGAGDCAICLTNPADRYVAPCGHVFGCYSCIERLKNCAVCRSQFNTSNQLFFI